MPQNFRKFFNQIYAGGAPSDKDLEYLKNILGVKLIVSLDQEVATKIAPMIKRLGMAHVVIPIVPSAVMDDNLKYLQRNIVRLLDNQQPVYIHCLYGKDRTGLALALYRVQKHGWDCQAALAEAKRYNYGTGISPIVQKLWEKMLCTLSQKGDVGNIYLPDAGNLVRTEYEGGNPAPLYFQQQSFAPYSSDVEGTPVHDPVGLPPAPEIPSIGTYNNVGAIRGTGPVENSGILTII